MKKIYALLFIIALIVPSCSGGGGSKVSLDPSTGWTIMVWLDGDNDLEWAAMEDLNEMEYGLYLAKQADPDIESKVQIIVQVDRAPGYDSSSSYTGSDWTKTRRYLIKPDSSVNSEFTSERIDSGLGEVNMGDASELKKFISFCKSNAPAPNYGLILWNHGGGLRKKSLSMSTTIEKKTLTRDICFDETSDNDALYTGEITDVLTSSESVDFLGFDACLMGMLEVAYEFRPGTGKFGADAITFSPATEQGDGWEYDRIIRRFASTAVDPEGDTCYDADSLTALQFAEIVAKEYEDAFGSQSEETQTAVDNSKVENVKEKLDALAVKIAAGSDYKNEIEAIRGSGSSTVTMEYFIESYSSEWVSYPFFDIYDFTERVSDGASGSITGSDVTAEAAALKTALEEFIIYSWAGSDYTGFQQGKNGLSFFFTDGDSEAYFAGTPNIAFQWWYTSEDVYGDWWPGNNYGKIDFCSAGSTTGTVENWFELLMAMYHDGDYDMTHPGPQW